MSKLKVATFVGTRPEIVRLSRVLAKLDEHCDHILIHTGQNYDYELNGVFFDDLGLRDPDHFLESAGKTAAETIGRVIIASDRLLCELQPDAVLVLGDTNSSMVVIAAKRHKVPTFHMEAGNRCFDMRVPEEINRRIADHTSDINLTYSDLAREHLLREGLPPDRIIKTGSPMPEVIRHYGDRIKASDAVSRLGLEPGKFFAVSAHREENVDSDRNFSGLVEILNTLAENYNLPVILSTHPRTRRRFEEMGSRCDARVRMLKPLGFTDYVKLQCAAKAVLSDSGTISEEASILNLRALNLRETHERHEAMDEAAVMMVGMRLERVLQALEILESQPDGQKRLIRQVADYSVPNVSDKVVRIVESYVDYVNRVVWNKC